ncbi:MAG: peptidylprolyl isomerase [Bacteroidetes bacterium]|nr:MAG: peptidylprolyl isomerase [Bacteroidota bacterium]
MKVSVSKLWLIGMIPLWLLSCTGSKQATQSGESGPILLSFAEGKVSQAEFERVYAKNNGGREAAAGHTEAQYREYLDLYINFKRKVFEAEAMGLDTTPAFQQEFESYRKQLAQPYLSAKEVEDSLVQEAYDRSHFMIRASHLLLTLAEDAAPADTQKVYAQIMAYRDSVLNHGVDFHELAARHSQDPSARENQGELGYFTVFDMVYPFEVAAYTTPVGQVSMPVRTQFGYHLVYVQDRLETAGKKRAAHIIVRVGPSYSAKTPEQAETQIREIYQKLQAGEDFGTLARQYSDDPGSAAKGGDLGSGRLLPVMENYKLQLEAGAYTEPFETPYGWHILKVTEVDSIPPFEEAQANLKQRIQRDARAQISRTALLDRIRTENDYQEFPDNLAAFRETVDETFPRGVWQPDSNQAELYARPLFTLRDDYTATVQDLIDYYRKGRVRRPRLSPARAVDFAFDSFVEAELLAYEEARLPEKNPDFRYLLQEYRDGILLFTLMEQKVWKKAVEDTVGLRAYYETHQDEFHADARIEVQEYRSTDANILGQVADLLKDGFTDAQIDSAINRGSALLVRMFTQTYEKGEEGLPASLFEAPIGHMSEVLSADSFSRLLVIKDKYPAGIKPFAQAKSEAITRYQDYLEAEWLKELAEKYPVEINEKAFANLFQ